MAVWVDPEGKRYWFDAEPDWDVVRADLVLEPDPPRADTPDTTTPTP